MEKNKTLCKLGLAIRDTNARSKVGCSTSQLRPLSSQLLLLLSLFTALSLHSVPLSLFTALTFNSSLSS